MSNLCILKHNRIRDCDIPSSVPCPTNIISFLMSFSLLYPTIKDGKHSSSKILNCLILGKNKLKKQSENSDVYPTLQSMDELAEICRDSKCTRDFKLLERQGLDCEDFKNKQITTHLNGQIRHWRMTIESSLGYLIQWIFLDSLNFNIQSHC